MFGNNDDDLKRGFLVLRKSGLASLAILRVLLRAVALSIVDTGI
jgi:hypothetical protein